ncbi:hypothetical protein XspCFBP7912_15295 [Xanthomonas sp. CFBP 7912]|nr:hypothetical protein XspCFBP7912_15295 [Xanthomonas sp. CFBP 7912]RJS04218.1 hypothetical protein XnspCFBP7698_11345 [Xanthomonas sp. CFBP 7698]
MTHLRPEVAPRTSKLFAWSKVILLCAPIALVPLSLFVDFAPAPFLRSDLWFWPMTALGAVLCVLLQRNARRHGREGIFNQHSRLFSVFMIGGAPILLGCVCLLLLCKLLPWLFTLAVGESFEHTYVMQTHYQHDRKLCEYRLTGGPMEGAVPSYLCINASSYRRHPKQPVQVLLTGQRSVLGLRIEGFYEK